VVCLAGVGQFLVSALVGTFTREYQFVAICGRSVHQKLKIVTLYWSK